MGHATAGRPQNAEVGAAADDDAAAAGRAVFWRGRDGMFRARGGSFPRR